MTHRHHQGNYYNHNRKLLFSEQHHIMVHRFAVFIHVYIILSGYAPIPGSAVSHQQSYYTTHNNIYGHAAHSRELLLNLHRIPSTFINQYCDWPYLYHVTHKLSQHTHAGFVHLCIQQLTQASPDIAGSRSITK